MSSWRSIGWKGRQGIGDGGNQFHYYRLSADNRILWGGYDAIYHYGSGLGEDLAQRPESFVKLASSLLRHLPAAGRGALQPHLGRCD